MKQSITSMQEIREKTRCRHFTVCALQKGQYTKKHMSCDLKSPFKARLQTDQLEACVVGYRLKTMRVSARKSAKEYQQSYPAYLLPSIPTHFFFAKSRRLQLYEAKMSKVAFKDRGQKILYTSEAQEYLEYRANISRNPLENVLRIMELVNKMKSSPPVSLEAKY